jgi:hypothetical protein
MVTTLRIYGQSAAKPLLFFFEYGEGSETKWVWVSFWEEKKNWLKI